MRLLLVEDEKKVSELVARALRAESYAVDVAEDGLRGWELAQAYEYDLIILDLMLPQLPGEEVLRRIRRTNQRVPILILTARGATEDKVHNFEAGADDYLTKPFAFAELLARIEALLRRRSSSPQTTRLKVEDLEFDLLERRVTRAGRELDLTAREMKLLEFLMRRAGQVVTRTMLLEGVWDLHFDPQSNLIDVHISRLRQAIDRGSDHPLIHTVRGSGYVLRSDS